MKATSTQAWQSMHQDAYAADVRVGSPSLQKPPTNVWRLKSVQSSVWISDPPHSPQVSSSSA